MKKVLLGGTALLIRVTNTLSEAFTKGVFTAFARFFARAVIFVALSVYVGDSSLSDAMHAAAEDFLS